MSRSDFVSVTIVTYNSGRFIKRCLESVFDQKYPFKEIIVIDNNSTDGTIDILEQFDTRDGCRIVYNEENIGFAAAQNQAVRLSDAEWVLTRAENPSADDVLLAFSAHGVPLKEIEQGDPYQAHIESTMRSVIERGHWPNPQCLCYQSRVGPGRWLQPTLDASLRNFAAQGAERVLVIPVSFVSDHVETLHEIDIEARGLAQKLGVRQFEIMPALNDSPTFIRALADLVIKAVKSNTSVASVMLAG
jgi:ferrochelatase